MLLLALLVLDARLSALVDLLYPVCFFELINVCMYVCICAFLQSVAQFMLSQADKDSRSETGLCFISDKNFVLLGALFAYFIPSSVAIVFAVLCRAEVRQLETHLYRGGRAYDCSCRTSTGKPSKMISEKCSFWRVLSSWKLNTKLDWVRSVMTSETSKYEQQR